MAIKTGFMKTRPVMVFFCPWSRLRYGDTVGILDVIVDAILKSIFNPLQGSIFLVVFDISCDVLVPFSKSHLSLPRGLTLSEPRASERAMSNRAVSPTMS